MSSQKIRDKACNFTYCAKTILMEIHAMEMVGNKTDVYVTLMGNQMQTVEEVWNMPDHTTKEVQCT